MYPVDETNPSFRTHRGNPFEAPCEISSATQVRMQVLEVLNLQSPVRQNAPSNVNHGRQIRPP